MEYVNLPSEQQTTRQQATRQQTTRQQVMGQNGARRPPIHVHELHVACMRNDVHRVNELLAMGADPSVRDPSGCTAIELASFLRRLGCVKSILSSNIDVAESGGFELLKAIRNGQPIIIQALLEMGVKNQLRDEVLFKGILVLACCIGTVQVFNSLVKHGPKISISTHERLLFQIAAGAGNSDTMVSIRTIAENERHFARAGLTEYITAQHYITPQNSVVSLKDITPEDYVAAVQKTLAMENFFELDDARELNISSESWAMIQENWPDLIPEELRNWKPEDEEDEYDEESEESEEDEED